MTVLFRAPAVTPVDEWPWWGVFGADRFGFDDHTWCGHVHDSAAEARICANGWPGDCSVGPTSAQGPADEYRNSMSSQPEED